MLHPSKSALVGLEPADLALIAQTSFATGAALADALEFHRSRIDDKDVLCIKMLKVAAAMAEQQTEMMARTPDDAIEPVLSRHFMAFVGLLSVKVECGVALQLTEELLAEQAAPE